MGAYDNIILVGLKHGDGEENPAGIAETAYLILLGDLSSEGAAATGTGPEVPVTITGNHIMKTGKSPIACYTNYEKSEFESAMTGEMFSRMFMPTVTLFIPQVTANNVGTFSVLKNARLMVLIKRPDGSTGFLQIGNRALSAKVKEGSVKLGKGITGEVGVTFQVEAPSIHPMYYYNGILPVTGV